MPKLKVPGESLKKRFRPQKAELAPKRNHSLKPVVTQRHEERKKLKAFPHKRNGLNRHGNDFYKVFGASDDEIEWEGFTLSDISNGDVTSERNTPKQRHISPISSSPSSLSPPSSPLPSSSSYRSPLYVGGTSKNKTTPTPTRKRRTRCMECSSCLRENDCGKCVNCRDKPKFGGPNSRKQACIYRKCTNLILDMPLKSTLPQKRSATDSNVPSSKRPAKGEGGGGGGLVPSPLKPRRVVPFKPNKDTSRPLVQLYWPDTLISTYPVYSSPLSSLPSPSSFDICTRCGSHGNEQFTYCQYCSQPYHLFCADIKETTPTGTTPTFTCPQCVNCQICGQTDKCIKCLGCKGLYHSSCLLGHTSDPRADNRNTWKCVQCTKCLSCHRNTPNKIEGIGNCVLSSLLAPTPSWSDGYCYCTDCYSLKAKGNSCPICGECYLDNDFDSKMIQCSQCDSWIHSRCENMPDEEYEILSDLPDSVEFICKLCTKSNSSGCGQEEKKAESSSSWREAVNEYKKESFNKIIALMRKSLGSLWINDINVTNPLISVNAFATLINAHLGKCADGVHTGSHKHRILYTSQQNYNQELEELFPWFSLGKEEEGKKTPPTTAPPTPTKLRCNIEKWPAVISHDHNYMSCDPRPHTSHDIAKVKLKNEPVVAMETTPKDTRMCILCTVKGDQPPKDAGRLLPCGGIDEWIHVNCALWSAEVYEDANGYLCCVHSAVGRGQRLKCDGCHMYGATVGCCHSSCSSNYHYLCARKKKCIFLNNKEVYCHTHSSLCDEGERVPEENMKMDHCVLIHTDNDRPGRKINKQLPTETVRLRIGSLYIQSLGRLTPLSDTVHHSLLIPHNFTSSSHFWSTLNPAHRTSYTLTIKASIPPEEEPLPLAPPIKETPPTSPEDYNWPCVSGLINEGCGLWAPISSLDQILASPSLTQTAHMLLKASDGFPVSDALKTFRIPRKTSHTHSPSPAIEEKKAETKEDRLRPIDSPYLNQWEKGLPTNGSGIQYTLTSGEGQSWEGSDLKSIWERVLSDLQNSRRQLDLPYIPYSSDNVYTQFGLNIELVLQLLEQLPNQEKCSRHCFIFHQPIQLSNWQQMRPVINSTGSARSEGYNNIRSESDMFSFLMSQWRPDPPQPDSEAVEIAILHAESQGSSNLRHQAQNDVPFAMRYRACQRTYHDTVSVFTSRIHGLGLFCLQEIDSGDMVIEYAGTVIRSILTDYRERYYESRGIGCYMFRIDNDDVVDATMSGNMARFINHSCEPNCYSKVIAVDGQKKIMIFALRKIIPGEELTYDYKFPIEDSKIPCKCGAPRCRKTLN